MATNPVLFNISENLAGDAPLGNAAASSQSTSPLMSLQNIQKYKPLEPVVNIPTVPENNSAMPTILAVLAAAVNRNFGPLMQLSEQKRKTQVYGQAAELLKKTYAKINTGQVDEAIEEFQAGITSMGGRAPEIGQFLQPEMARMSAVQQASHERTGFVKYLKNYSELIKDKEPERSDRLKRVANFVGSVPAYMTNKTIFDTLEKELNPQRHVVDNRSVSLSPSGTEVTAIPEVMTDRSMGGGFTVDKLLSDPELRSSFAAVGIPLTQPSIINILNDKSEGTVGLRVAIAEKMSQYRGLNADLEMSKLIPKRPETAEMLTLAGTPMQDIALWNVGNRIGGAIDRVIAKTGEVVSEQERAKLEVDNIKNYGQPLTLALKGLDYIEDLFFALGNPDTWDQRLETGIARILSNRFGVSLGEDITQSKAYELIINRAIESIENTVKLPEGTAGQLKKLITGPFAGYTDAKLLHKILRGRIEEQLILYTSPDELERELKEIKRKAKESGKDVTTKVYEPRTERQENFMKNLASKYGPEAIGPDPDARPALTPITPEETKKVTGKRPKQLIIKERE